MRNRIPLAMSLFVTLLALMLVAACVPVAPAAQSEDSSALPKDVTLMLGWTPNTNYTGIYVARENGWYEEAGLNVDIVLPGQSDVHKVVGSGSADFGFSYQEGTTFARNEGVPVVSVAAIIQHNTSGFASRSSAGKGITTPTAPGRQAVWRFWFSYRVSHHRPADAV